MLAIFDLDGTLVDSVGQIGSILNRTRIEFGFSALPDSYFQENVGLPLEALIADLEISSQEKFMLINVFRDYLVADIEAGNCVLFDGVLNGLNHLSDSNVALAIATSKPTYVARSVYMNSGLCKFRIHIQGTDGFLPKPHPEVIRRVLAEFPMHMALMVGDRTEDIDAAKAAHVPSVGIASSSHSTALLREHGARATLDSFAGFYEEYLNNFEFFSQLFN